jgi:hypothetical protein
MRRRLARLALLALLVITTFPYPLLAPTAHRIDEAHFDLIADGMTKADVEAIFGVPAGKYDWATEDYSIRHFFPENAEWSPGSEDTMVVPRLTILGRTSHAFDGPDGHEMIRAVVWVGRWGACTIHFDHHHRVTAARYFWPHTRIEPPWNRWWANLRGQQ